MSYAYPYSRKVVSDFLEFYPRACVYLKFLTGLTYKEIHDRYTEAFQKNQLKWRALKIMTKQLDYWEWSEIKRIPEEHRLAYVKYFRQIADDSALDTYSPAE